MKRKVQTLAISTLVIALFLLTIAFFLEKGNEIKPVLLSISLTLIPSAIVALIYEYNIRKSFVDELNTQLATVIESQFENVRNISEFGIHSCIPELSEDDLIEIISESDTLVRITKNWIPKLVGVEREFLHVINRGGKVEICLTDPASPFSVYRSECLRKEKTHVGRNTMNNLLELKDFRTQHNLSDSQLEVRLNPCYIPMSIHQADNKLLFGIMWEGMLANHHPMIKVSGYGKKLFKTIVQHSQNQWDLSNPVDWSSIK